jgi:hypothetical protein
MIFHDNLTLHYCDALEAAWMLARRGIVFSRVKNGTKIVIL